MNPLSARPSSGRFQSILLRVRFADIRPDMAPVLGGFYDLIQKLAPRFGLAGLMLEAGCEAVLGLEGGEAEIDGLLGMLRTPVYGLEIEIPWRLCVEDARYRSLAVTRPTLTPSERVWLRMEIRNGFGSLGTLPTLIDWLALRQVHPDLSRKPVLRVGRAVSKTMGGSAEIIPLRPRSA